MNLFIDIIDVEIRAFLVHVSDAQIYIDKKAKDFPDLHEQIQATKKHLIRSWNK